MYFLLGISLIFASLLIFNAAASIFASVLWRFVSKSAVNWSAQKRARFIFALRVFPFAGALVFVSAFLLPAYLLFEPYASDESVGFKLAFLSTVSAVGGVCAFVNIFRTRRATRRLVSDWMKYAEPIEIADVPIPVYRFSHPFPVIAVVGALRPRMFVANQIFALLDEKEFQAVIRHETGHLAARDNLKRTLMRVCRDLLVFPFFGRTLDRAWAENAESGADEFAARRGGNMAAVDLAAALLKIARIVPHGAKPSMPAGAFLIEEQTAEIAFRVQRLLQMTEAEKVVADRRAYKFSLSHCYAAALAAVLLLATNHDFLKQIHHAVEAIVALLQ